MKAGSLARRAVYRFLAIASALGLQGGFVAAQSNLTQSRVSSTVSLRPFLFTVATEGSSEPRWLLYADTGYGERGQDPIRTDGLQQYLGVQGSLGHGLTVLARIGFGAKEEGGVGNLEEAELLKDVLGGSTRLAAGVGVRREPDSSWTALGRLVVGRSFGNNSLFANVRFERSFEGGRDELDLVTSIGWMHRLGSIGSVGIEVLGQDLEGLWDAEEAEGGARVFVGPTVRVAIPSTRLYAALGAGPVLQASRSPRTSNAPRDLATRTGYSVRLSLGYQP